MNVRPAGRSGETPQVATAPPLIIAEIGVMDRFLVSTSSDGCITNSTTGSRIVILILAVAEPPVVLANIVNIVTVIFI